MKPHFVVAIESANENRNYCQNSQKLLIVLKFVRDLKTSHVLRKEDAR